LGQAAFIPVWVCAVAMCALAVHGASGVAPRTVTGIGDGCVLATFALAKLLSVSARKVPNR
jgi:hypothetical protein